MSLVISVGVNQHEAAIFLDDTHVLCDDNVLSINSVVENYPSISQLVVPVEKSLLPYFITLFLSYVSNITTEINGIPPRYSKHTEHPICVPTRMSLFPAEKLSMISS